MDGRIGGTKIKMSARDLSNQLRAELCLNLRQELLKIVALELEDRKFRFGSRSQEVMTILGNVWVLEMCIYLV
jgi:hypothetical protein